MDRCGCYYAGYTNVEESEFDKACCIYCKGNFIANAFISFAQTRLDGASDQGGLTPTYAVISEKQIKPYGVFVNGLTNNINVLHSNNISTGNDGILYYNGTRFSTFLRKGVDYDNNNAGINRFGVSDNRPINPITGTVYYDTIVGKPLWYNGTTWITYPDSSGSTMATLTFTGAVEATYNGSTPVTVNIPTGGGGTTNYEDLSNKPKIGDVELVGTKTLVQLGIQPAGDYATETYVTEQITAAIGTINTALDNINGEVI